MVLPSFDDRPIPVLELNDEFYSQLNNLMIRSQIAINYNIL